MKIVLQEAGKRYNKHWIFKNLDLELNSGNGYVVLGPNGSGKSTLLQVVSGFQSLSVGSIQYADSHGKAIDPDNFFSYISFASPYLELVEEFTLTEMIHFYRGLKPFRKTIGINEAIELSELGASAHKPIRHFSSGMKQRLKLTLAILAEAPVLLLDEPLSNLDSSGTSWYKKMLADHASGKLIVVGSNHNEDEYGVCGNTINITDHK